MEVEIQNILNNIKKKEIRTLEEIRKQNKEVILAAYEPFFEFEANIKNYNEIKKTNKLDYYEYVEYDLLSYGDYIRFFDKTYFFNMKLHAGGKVISVRDDKLLIRTPSGSMIWIRFDNYIFRHLDSEDLAKIKLVELINYKLN